MSDPLPDTITTTHAPEQSPAVRPENAYQDANGRFKHGNPGGGRLPKGVPAVLARSKRLKAAIKKELAKKDVTEIARAIIEDAKYGKKESQELLFALLRE